MKCEDGDTKVFQNDGILQLHHYTVSQTEDDLVGWLVGWLVR
jgi:hypothetical protein